MRLTLRTLLSYLDNVLDEAAHAELDRQIQSSEHAGEWVHRTRDVMRRLKLEAPPIDGEGLADDPNTVAEYLDRTLPEQGVAEFERVCLESDSMLAEVASCHHALALFLNESPQIDPDTRRRLHRLQGDLDQALSSRPTAPPIPPQLQDTAPIDPPAESTAPVDQPAPKPEVPDYLRSSQQAEWVRWAPAIAALLLLMLTAFVAFGPGGPLANPAPAVANKKEAADDSATDESLSADDSESQAVASGDDEVTPTDPDPAATQDAAGEGQEAQEEAVEPTDSPPTPTVIEGVASERPAEPVEEEPQPVEPTEIIPGQEALADSFTPLYQDEQSGFAVAAADPAGWVRLLPGTEFTEATRLVVLPTSRVTITLGKEFRAVVAGPAELTVDRSATGTPVVDLLYGRLLLSNDAVGDSSASAVVVIDGLPHDTTISAGGALALEVDRFYTPGWPVLETPAPISAVANSLAGVIEWSTRGEEMRISKPKQWSVAGSPDAAPRAGFGTTDWVERDRLSEVVRRASAEIASVVTPDEPVGPQLRKIATEDPFRENRALAAASNAVLGRPDTLVESFRAKEAKDDWRLNLSRLRQAASRSPRAASATAASFDRAYGPQETEELLELLVGFTPEEFGKTPEAVGKGVAVEILLPALISDDLAVRVLGSLVLQELVEPYEPAFRPLASARRRIGAVRRLESLIEDAELIPRDR